jgi:HAMP domain-containing protein
MSGYLTILFVSVVAMSFCLISLTKNRNMDQQVSDVYYPTLLYLKDVGSFATESYNLSNNWIYQPNNKDKDRLRKLHSEEYARLNAEMASISAKIQNDLETEAMTGLSKNLQQVLASEKLVMDKLNNEEAYGNDVTVDEAIAILTKNVTPDYQNLQKGLSQAVQLQNSQLANAITNKNASFTNIFGALVSALILFIVIIAFASWFSINTIQKPVKELSGQISELSTGKFVSISTQKRNDEIGTMTDAIAGMVNGLKQKAEFADKIGKGQYSSHFDLLSQEDTMGQALITMRDNLKKAAEEDRKRNWVTEGLAKFVDILRTNHTDNHMLSDNILSHLIKYLNANQGALFVVNDDNAKDAYLELVACYAYDRKKFIGKRIEMGEGLVGQAFLEKDTIYMTDVPSSYVHITSGLGEATPNAVLIVPLKINEEVYGILEIASFDVFEQYQIDFVEKLGESIASTISTSKINERTTKLLAQTQVQAEEMRAQEEEMRQNMEELQATQEEMARKESGYISQIEELTEKLALV